MSFWTRAHLTEADRSACLAAIQRTYPGYRVEEHEHQGLCSYTLLLSPPPPQQQLVVQIRVARHALREEVARAAREVYGAVAPEVRAVGVWLPRGLGGWEMGRVGGTPLSVLMMRGGDAVGAGRLAERRALVVSFAGVVAQGWPKGKGLGRRDSGVLPSSVPRSFEDARAMLPFCTGRVGSRIAPKLAQLAAELPDGWLRAEARDKLDRIQSVHDYPVVLTHGDLIPSNVLVDDDTWTITGLVDWAEAEPLPFGTCLYGLEHLLGALVSEPRDGGMAWVYRYGSCAPELRELFYNTLVALVPELGHRQEELRLMRDVGVLLWHGYAWDDGAVDRVVDEGRDGEELAKLRAMLSV
ncbi:hypothetical protein G6514_006476 [Epicoccum nigrum]|nr:hypothetical protein G6514_006476 [Epicoccum nigrum]